MEEKELLAVQIAKYRKKANLTQSELAQKLNYSDKSVSKWERGEGAPDIYVLLEMAKLLNVPLEVLVYGDEVLPENPKTDEEIEADLEAKARKKRRHRYMLYISIAIVILVASTIFVSLSIALPNPEFFEYWLIFVYCSLLIAVAIFVFIRVEYKRVSFICLTLIIWTTFASMFLSLYKYIDYSWLLSVIALAANVLFFFYSKYRNLVLKNK